MRATDADIRGRILVRMGLSYQLVDESCRGWELAVSAGCKLSRAVRIADELIAEGLVEWRNRHGYVLTERGHQYVIDRGWIEAPMDSCANVIPM